MSQLDRREFLGAALAVGGVLAFPRALRAGAPDDAPRRTVVLLHLVGGNDGLNTVVPFASARYRVLRPTLALERGAVLPLSNDLALHPSLRPLDGLWRRGRLAIVNGVGYPNPEEAYLVGLFANLGALCLAAYYPTEYERATALARDRRIPLEEATAEVFGLDASELATAMLARWDFPSSYTDYFSAPHPAEDGRRQREEEQRLRAEAEARRLEKQRKAEEALLRAEEARRREEEARRQEEEARRRDEEAARAAEAKRAAEQQIPGIKSWGQFTWTSGSASYETSSLEVGDHAIVATFTPTEARFRSRWRSASSRAASARHRAKPPPPGTPMARRSAARDRLGRAPGSPGPAGRTLGLVDGRQ